MLATYESMAESLRGGLSLGLSGFGFWSHDIGGFQNTAPAHVYKRWCAFGLLSSHSRLHGFSSYRVPWIYDDEAVDVLRAFTKLKCRLMPYLFAAAAEAARSGAPMMRAMVLEFPDDPACETLDRQYMLGPSLLVAPVFSEDGQVSFYLPEGRWTHLLTGEVVDGGRWRKERHGFQKFPLYARPNSLIVWGRRDDRPDTDFADGAVFAAYGLDERADASASIVAASGSEILQLTIRRDHAVIDAIASVPDRVLEPAAARGDARDPRRRRRTGDRRRSPFRGQGQGLGQDRVQFGVTAPPYRRNPESDLAWASGTKGACLSLIPRRTRASLAGGSLRRSRRFGQRQSSGSKHATFQPADPCRRRVSRRLRRLRRRRAGRARQISRHHRQLQRLPHARLLSSASPIFPAPSAAPTSASACRAWARSSAAT